MTITEAMDKGVARVRKPYWSRTESLELPPKMPNGGFGPWFTLRGLDFSPSGEVIEKATQIPFFQADDKANDWEEFHVETASQQ